MAKKTSSFIRKLYKGALLAALGATAFVLRLQNDTPEAHPFDKAHAEVPVFNAPDCPGGPGDCE